MVRKPTPAAAPDRSHDRLMRKAETQQLMGGCSHMHLKRLCLDRTTGFPQPIYVGRTPYWWHGDVVRWIDRQARQPLGRPPQADNFAKANARRRAARAEVGHG
jgi:hypothetical protein